MGAGSSFGPRRGLLITAYLHHITLDTAATTSRVARMSSCGEHVGKIILHSNNVTSLGGSKCSQIYGPLADLAAREWGVIYAENGMILWSSAAAGWWFQCMAKEVDCGRWKKDHKNLVQGKLRVTMLGQCRELAMSKSLPWSDCHLIWDGQLSHV